ncbi:MAG TPA: prepilin-type N-terminal cleavage/methylation domain-containing protein, partial [Deferrisomatales bacterium]|nr:prepilin-type N-terminal cleavage/methylation domain-containing protein [Deferrisomatales bacterium]
MHTRPPSATRGPAPRSAGFTLSELLVSLAVASIIVVLVYQVFVSQQRVFTTQEDVGEAQQNARVAVDELTRTVSPLGAGAAVDQGQVRILMAHPDQLLFNADLSGDHDALAAGTDLTTVAGYSADDPYAAVPGSYASSAAETYRYYLRPDAGGVHHSLYREINLTSGGAREVAMHLGNVRVGQALFTYYGDFDGDGTFETLERVDLTTSSRVAAGAPLDAVIRRIDLNVIAETPYPDPRLAANSGYRQTVLKTSITPRNVWDCPIVQPVPPGLGILRAPALRGTTTALSFRVTRGSLAEQGRTVLFTVDGPTGFTDTTDQGTTAADGLITTQILWPNPGPPCATLPGGTYTVTAITSTPPSLDTPFGT